MILLELFMLTVIVCFIIDLSGIQDSVKRAIWKWVFNNKKPFQDFEMKFPFCSLCMTHHILLLYVLFTNSFSIFVYMFICLLSFQSSNITSFLIGMNDVVTKFINKIF